MDHEIVTCGKIFWNVAKIFSGDQKDYGFLESPLFSVGEGQNKTKWVIRMSPRRNSSCIEDVVKLFLELRQERRVRARYQFTLLGNEGPIPSPGLDRLNIVRCFTEFGCRGRAIVGVPISNIIDSKDLEDLSKRYGNTMSIGCEIKVYDVVPDWQPIPRSQGLWNSPSHKYLDFLNYPPDVKIRSPMEDHVLLSHKLILAAMSPVFRAMFRHADMRENLTNVVETEFSLRCMSMFQSFMYFQRIEEVMNPYYYLEPAVAADYYDVPGLKALCAQAMSKNVSIKNVFEVLEVAYKTGLDPYLVPKCVEILKANPGDGTVERCEELMEENHDWDGLIMGYLDWAPVEKELELPAIGLLDANLQKMYEDQEMIDVILKCEGGDVFCHKMVLAAYSEKFKSMLNGSKTGQLEIKNFSYKCMSQLVGYLYSTVVEFKDITPDLILASDYFEIVELRRDCEMLLKHHLDRYTVVEIFQLGYMIPSLARSCVELMIDDDIVLNSEKYKDGILNNPSLNHIYANILIEMYKSKAAFDNLIVI